MIKKPEKQGVYLRKISQAQAKNRLILSLVNKYTVQHSYSSQSKTLKYLKPAILLLGEISILKVYTFDAGTILLCGSTSG